MSSIDQSDFAVALTFDIDDNPTYRNTTPPRCALLLRPSLLAAAAALTTRSSRRASQFPIWRYGKPAAANTDNAFDGYNTYVHAAAAVCFSRLASLAAALDTARGNNN